MAQSNGWRSVIAWLTRWKSATPAATYEVTHSSAVYIFDAQGHARLLATDNDSIDTIAHDVRRVIDSTKS